MKFLIIKLQAFFIAFCGTHSTAMSGTVLTAMSGTL